MSREREYRITWNSEKTWSCKYTFQQLADVILVPEGAALTLDADAYLIASDNDLITSFGDRAPGYQFLSE